MEQIRVKLFLTIPDGLSTLRVVSPNRRVIMSACKTLCNISFINQRGFVDTDLSSRLKQGEVTMEFVYGNTSNNDDAKQQ